MTAFRLLSSRHHRYGEQFRFLRSFAAYSVQTSGEQSTIWYWHGHEPRCLLVREMSDGLEVMGEEAVARRIFRTEMADVLPEEALPDEPVAHRLLHRRYAGIRPVLFANTFEGIAWTILGQQIRVTMAVHLKNNIAARYGEPVFGWTDPVRLFPRADHLLTVSAQDLQGLQLSQAKATALLSLARCIADGKWDDASLLGQPTAEALARLEAFHGIGRWSAEYILLRVVGHPDVIPARDVALQRAWSRLTGTAVREPELRQAGAAWKGWRSDFAFYLWLDNLAYRKAR